MRSPITTHVLDTARGRPAVGVEVRLEQTSADGYEQIGEGITNDDGRVGDLLAFGHKLVPGIYRLTFLVGPYLEASGEVGFFPQVPIEFRVDDPTQHYHVPLLLSPFGYSTYRGS